MSVEDSLGELGLELPEMAKPAGAYVPAKRTGNLIYVAGQLPLKDGKLLCKCAVGRSVSVDEAYEAGKQLTGVPAAAELGEVYADDVPEGPRSTTNGLFPIIALIAGAILVFNSIG